MGEMVAELLSHMPVAIMSGASMQQFETQFLPHLPETAHFERLYLFPTNAAKCFTYQGGQWKARYDKSFNTFEKGRIMQAIKESLEETGLADDSSRPKEWGERIEDREAQITFSALGQRAPIEEKQKWDPSGAKRKPLREALVRRLPDFEIRTNATTSIDITRKGITKAYGVRQLVEIAGVSVAEILYVGDALNEGGNDSVVIETGVHAHEVFGPEETAALIKDVLKSAAVSV
jgi:HAD superfamily hydrolase (TIGR01484 family)